MDVRHVRLVTVGERMFVSTLGERRESIIGSIGMDERVRRTMLEEVTAVRTPMEGSHRARVMTRAVLIAPMLVVDGMLDVQEMMTRRRLTMPKMHPTVRRPTVNLTENERQYDNDLETVVH